MLIGLDPLLVPDLLHALASMGHGDTVVIADANFPSARLAQRLVRLPGVSGRSALQAVMSVLPLDTFVARPVAVMQVVGAPAEVPEPVLEYQAFFNARLGRELDFEVVERHAFYERAQAAFVVVATGDTRPYGNILVTKGGLRAPLAGA
jgi:L-fucose mutarotase